MPELLSSSVASPIRHAAFAVAVMLLLVSGCNKGPAPADVKAEKTAQTKPEVKVVEVKLQAWPHSVRVQGTLMPHEQSVVGTRIAGEVDKVLVDLGSVVKAGDPLIALDDKELTLSVSQAEAQLAQA